MRIIHIITGLGDGGAEHTLYKICKYDSTNEHLVISLKDDGKYYYLLKKLGIRVFFLNFKLLSITKFFFLIKLIKSLKPQIVQTWLVHGDFIGGIAAYFAGVKKIVWNVRYSKIEINKSKFITVFIIKILALLSFCIPKLIIIVSKKAKKIYQIIGYDKDKLKFIPNGYDLLMLKNNKLIKNVFKKKIKIKKNIPLIGYVSRFDPLKDHLNLLQALSLVQLRNIDFFCVLVGTNIRNNKLLTDKIKAFNLNKNIKLIDPVRNISNIMSSLDIHVQSSLSEGFPNVVAEAMACKTPCIVTNVGDSSFIVGKNGWVVPPKNSIKLANAIVKALSEIRTKNWNKRRNLSRLRIKENFSIGKMIKSYNKIWIKVYKMK